MPLTNIEYGSLASSSTLNQNFTYLANQITSNHTTLQTSISSLLSNIATINTRLTELSDDIEDLEDDVDTKLSSLKTKTKNLVNSVVMLPDWSNYSAIADISYYRATGNGYVSVTPSGSGNITINDKSVTLNQSSLNIFPIKKGDVISTSASISSAYFLPITEAVWEVSTS